MKRLLNRHLTATDSDKHTIRLLRQEFTTNETQYRLGYISQEEYETNLQTMTAKITALESKYGMGTDR